mmetsp:Transcript_15759/g.50855  ORF Transcript_15759/g.50855 Transcript_15759/m.50855 type:complete len:158 (+) Transcript_15759:28-501(+)
MSPLYRLLLLTFPLAGQAEVSCLTAEQCQKGPEGGSPEHGSSICEELMQNKMCAKPESGGLCCSDASMAEAQEAARLADDGAPAADADAEEEVNVQDAAEEGAAEEAEAAAGGQGEECAGGGESPPEAECRQCSSRARRILNRLRRVFAKKSPPCCA